VGLEFEILNKIRREATLLLKIHNSKLQTTGGDKNESSET